MGLNRGHSELDKLAVPTQYVCGKAPIGGLTLGLIRLQPVSVQSGPGKSCFYSERHRGRILLERTEWKLERPKKRQAANDVRYPSSRTSFAFSGLLIAGASGGPYSRMLRIAYR